MMTSWTTYSDEQLLLLLREGDEGAFTEIYNRHWEQLALYVLKVIRSREEARDIVQEVFISVWKRRQELEIRSSLVAYLLRSVRNLAIRHIERDMNRYPIVSQLSEYTGDTTGVSAPDAIELKQLEERVDNAIAKLPPKMREIFILSRQENLSYREIAEKLGIAETTVKKQVSNALKNIRTDLGGLSSTAIIYMAWLS